MQNEKMYKVSQKLRVGNYDSDYNATVVGYSTTGRIIVSVDYYGEPRVEEIGADWWIVSEVD